MAGLHPAQQFIGIAAHIAGKNFIGYDFTFGINNKAAAFRHTVRLDVYPKISRQGMGGIGQHGVLDFADALQNSKAAYAGLNYGQAVCPREIHRQTICINEDIGDVLSGLYNRGHNLQR